MKKLLFLLILIAVTYVGLRYRQSQVSSMQAQSIPDIRVKKAESQVKYAFDVLGASTSNLYQTAIGYFDDRTGLETEPLINKAFADLQTKLNRLPQEEYTRVKYEFCKDVIESPSPGVAE